MSILSAGLEGGCACGETRYRLAVRPLVVHACHCGSCQRLTGAWHAVNALIESHEVHHLSGELINATLPTASGAGQTITRCARCYSALWSIYHQFCQGRGDIVRFIRVGTLDDPSSVPVDVHIFATDRNNSAPEPANAPVYDGFYELGSVWSAASLRRLSALFADRAQKLGSREQAIQTARSA